MAAGIIKYYMNSFKRINKSYSNHIIIVPAFMVMLCILLSGCRHITSENEERQFSAFTEDCFKTFISKDILTLHFKVSDPSRYGLSEHTAAFEDISLKSKQDNCRQAADFLARLRSFDPSGLSEEQKLTRDIFERKLQQIVNSKDYMLYGSYLGTNGLPSQIPVSLSEYYFDDEDDIRNYLLLLNDIPDLFKQMIIFEQARNKSGFYVPAFTIANTIRQIDHFLEGSRDDQLLLSTFEERINALSFLSDDQKKSYIKNNQALFEQVVIPAYQSLKDTLASWETPEGTKERLCQYEKGRDYYASLLLEHVGTDKTPEECISLLKKHLADIIKETAAVNASAPDLYTEYLSSQPLLSDPEEILSSLKSEIVNDFPETGEVSCSLKELPSSLSGTSAAAFYLIPPIDAADTNVIYINKAKVGGRELFSTLAHEGYPGHLYQTNYYMNKETDPLRHLMKTAGYDEGWGTYAQLYSYNYIEFKDVDEQTSNALRILYRNNDLLSLTLSSLSDLYVNYKDYDREKLSEFLSSYGVKEENASSIYEYVAENPTTYLTYCIGYYELEDLKNKAEADQEENFSIKDFHKKVLDCGSCPFDILREYVL